ncbi:MAG: phytanoyl-CoA dioxygenase family protein [Planctomycetota bacterium]|nr:phytanoyl-CoA dioxygenase family protein [Planctomycetota bacterium]MDA1140731.1 phytanoyl-CoA dioxygenase family protein [Planctomycetota bacterium]
MSVLTSNQIEQFQTDGYFLASGLISDDIARRAEDFMWELLGMDRHAPSTWSTIPEDVFHDPRRNLIEHFAVKNEALLACATPEFMIATSQFLGVPKESFHMPRSVQTQNVFPMPGPWRPPGFHIDGIPEENKHKTFPGPFKIAFIVFLSDVEPQGGGTFAWPGSHLKIAELARTDPEKFEYLYVLNRHLSEADLGDPVELLPRRGDILFFQHLWAHGATMNCNVTPRMALRFLCSCESCLRWKKRDGWSFWTP